MNPIRKINYLRHKYLSVNYFMMILGVLIGFLSGIAATIIKNLVHLIKTLSHEIFPESFISFFYFIFPVIGILLALLFIKYILRKPIGHGIPAVLYAISKNLGFIKVHNTFSSVITSGLTVGMGGSVGLEGPTVATGGAIGAYVGKLFNLDYQQRVILLGCASAGAMSAIFKAPVAGVVFAIEVIMIDLTTRSLIPILLASVTGSLTTFLFYGQNVLYTFHIDNTFTIGQVPYYILLGVFTGLVAVYFTKIYVYFESLFSKVKKKKNRLLIGGFSLGLLVFLFPALYGEGFEAINSSLKGDYSYLYKGTFLTDTNNIYVLLSLLLAMILLKVVAASLTFGAGGVGGIFAPTLFMGANAGLFLAILINHSGIGVISESNSALVGMGGLIAGVLHAPLTGIFLIADISHGYGLFVPLMITSAIAYITVKIFVKNNVYTIQLAKRGQLMTHHTDKNVLLIMNVSDMLEKDFHTVNYNQTLGELVEIISKSKRNIYPIIDEDGNLAGIIPLNRVREIMFKPKLYDTILVQDLMHIPAEVVYRGDDMADIAEKLQSTGKVYLPVLEEDGKYAGFVSRANVFSEYRRLLQEFSAD